MAPAQLSDLMAPADVLHLQVHLYGGPKPLLYRDPLLEKRSSRGQNRTESGYRASLSALHLGPPLQPVYKLAGVIRPRWTRIAKGFGGIWGSGRPQLVLAIG